MDREDYLCEYILKKENEPVEYYFVDIMIARGLVGSSWIRKGLIDTIDAALRWTGAGPF